MALCSALWPRGTAARFGMRRDGDRQRRYNSAAGAGQSVEDFKAGVAANIALGHIPPDQDCAKSILLLLSDYACEITGASLDVNGGEYMPQ